MLGITNGLDEESTDDSNDGFSDDVDIEGATDDSFDGALTGPDIVFNDGVLTKEWNFLTEKEQMKECFAAPVGPVATQIQFKAKRMSISERKINDNEQKSDLII